MSIGKLYKSGDWTGEKHVPRIECPDTVKAGEMVKVTVNIGSEDPHPNTLEHNIAWIKVFFEPEGSNFPVELGTYNFSAHGEFDSFSEPDVTFSFKTDKPGNLIATSYCNIHGLWENSKELKVEA